MDRFFKTANADRYMILKCNANKNRNEPTIAEAFLWKQLKGKRLGVKFLRQVPILDFIADFACLEQKIIIEVDGEYHMTADQQKDDQARSARLQKMGFKVIRFTNQEVLYETSKIIGVITQTISGTPSL